MFSCLGCTSSLDTCPPYLNAGTFLSWVNSSSLCACVGDITVPAETAPVDYCSEAFSEGAPDCCPMMFISRSDGAICFNYNECDDEWICISSSGDTCVGVAEGTDPEAFITEAFGGVCPSSCDVITVVDGDGNVWISSNVNNNCSLIDFCPVCGGSGNCTEIVPVGTASNTFLSFFATRPTFEECPVLKVCYDSEYPHLVHCWELVNDGLSDTWVNTTNGRSSVIELSLPATVSIPTDPDFTFINFTTVPYDDLDAFNGTSFTVQDTGDYIIGAFASLCDTSIEADARTLAIFINGAPIGGTTLTDSSSADNASLSYSIPQRLAAGNIVQLGFRGTEDTCLTEVRLAIAMIRKLA